LAPSTVAPLTTASGWSYTSDTTTPTGAGSASPSLFSATTAPAMRPPVRGSGTLIVTAPPPRRISMRMVSGK
jgi:hypothetical protein